MAGGGEGGEYEVNINLTALLDVLTNLLFFLMMGAAAQSATVQLEGGFELPNSTSDAPMTKTLQVTIGRRDLRVEKEPIIEVRDGHVAGKADNVGRIDVLFNRLQAIKNSKPTPAAGKKKPEDADVVLLFCDKDAPYALMHQVMTTAAEAGYVKFRMAVLME
jgi:biopolymer transport protein ExbD